MYMGEMERKRPDYASGLYSNFKRKLEGCDFNLLNASQIYNVVLKL